MAQAFRRKGERYLARMDAQEREIVVGLLVQARDLLALDEAPSSGDPLRDLLDGLGRSPASQQEIAQRDPALRRLLPRASRDDDDVATDFRELAENNIRRAKAAHLQVAIAVLSFDKGSKVDLDHEQAKSLMIGVGDVRLILADRLDIQSDEDAEKLHERVGFDRDTDLKTLFAAYYEFLTWLQESLAQTLTVR